MKKQKKRINPLGIIFFGIALAALIFAIYSFTSKTEKPAENATITIIEENKTTPVPEEQTLNFTMGKIPDFDVYLNLLESSTNVLAFADCNNDNYPDLAVGNFIGQNFLFMNNGKGNFTKKQAFGFNGVAMAWADSNKDGYLDMAVAIANNYYNALYINNGDESFSEIHTFKESYFDRDDRLSYAWSDYNKDGYPDLAVGVYKKSNYLYINNGNGTFTPSENFGTDYDKKEWQTNDLAWGDFNKDGYPDLLIANYNQQSYIYVNIERKLIHLDAKGQRVLNRSLPVGEIGIRVRDAEVADFNNDGWDDAAFGNFGQQNYLFLNNHDGTFKKIEAFGKGNTVGIVSGDFNNDNLVDLAVANYNEQSYIYYNKGDGTFEEVKAFEPGNTHTFAVADVDRDGDLDIAVGRYNQPTYIYLNKLKQMV